MLYFWSFLCVFFFFFFQAEDGIRDKLVTGVQTCALPISSNRGRIDDKGAVGRRPYRVLRAQSELIAVGNPLWARGRPAIGLWRRADAREILSRDHVAGRPLRRHRRICHAEVREQPAGGRRALVE